ncbi:MAG: 2-C-methyl-D-erythritol 4-phosphate cytidylyltransferase [Rhodothermales bacterium]|nr:2-C-methyl-D-erythritol 4-phosphate cytidylyltransferase [Rhodothermales bacterium]
MNDVAVIIPAAGSGKRIGGTPKQFRLLGGEPMLHRTIKCFDGIEEIGMLVVVVPAESVADSERALADLHPHSIVVTPGGPTRQDSVRLGLARVRSGIQVVLVHDAARPFVSIAEIEAVISSTRQHGAAALAIPATDTLRKSSGATLGETVDREGVYRMQTPQGFTRDLIVEAHASASRKGDTATDDVELVMLRGHAVRLVVGRSTNFKITTAEDWTLAEAIVESAEVGGSA